MIKYIYTYDKDKWEEYRKLYVFGILVYKSIRKLPTTVHY